MKSNPDIKYYLILVSTTFLWATAFVGIRYTAEAYTAGPLALLRYLVASIVMFFIYWTYPNKTKPNFHQLLMMLSIGVLGFTIYNVMLNQGERTVPAALAGFIIAQTPVIVSVIAIMFFNERLRFWGVIGFAISIIGLLLIVIAEKEHGQFDIGIVFLLIALVSNSIYIVLQKQLLTKFHAIELISFAIWGGTFILLIYTPTMITEIKQADFVATVSVIYMGVFPGAIAYVLWSYGFSHLLATKASSFLYLIPFLTLVLGWLCLNEMPPKLALIGGIIALLGAFIINKNSHRKNSLTKE